MYQDSDPEEPSSDLFPNIIQQLRDHWVDQAARRQGVGPDDVSCALILGATGDAEVRINEAVKAALYIDDDRIMDLDETIERLASGENFLIRALIPDVPPDQPFSFFDLRLGYLVFDWQPRRAWAKRHMMIAEQFWHAARDLVSRGGLNAACENMFAAAELATMALMEVSEHAGLGHHSRSEWLRTNGPAYGLSDTAAAVLEALYRGRNVYRYGDSESTITPVELLGLLPHVEALLDTSRMAVRRSADDHSGR
jgi:HEPN domain-containing protein